MSDDTLRFLLIVISGYLPVSYSQIMAPGMTLKELGLDALDLLGLRLELEKRSGIQIPEDLALAVVTVDDLGALMDNLFKNGVPVESTVKPVTDPRALLAAAMAEDEGIKQGCRTGIERVRRDLELDPQEATPYTKPDTFKDRILLPAPPDGSGLL